MVRRMATLEYALPTNLLSLGVGMKKSKIITCES